ncbi:alpha-isopropylmalate synthase regulatory domain-containing protein, partial [Rhizobium leguminosarum]|uniref:alpha-isopropylmalate synthase regulatory domain-containing protein n=1 Tax=Rhizobium leguminosarum TaxID=384 RepID=UPI003F988A3D
KVRILNGGTEAITRVLIESTDSDGLRWWTVGVSENIIDASFQALLDSVIYKLMKNRQPDEGQHPHFITTRLAGGNDMKERNLVLDGKIDAGR